MQSPAAAATTIANAAVTTIANAAAAPEAAVQTTHSETRASCSKSTPACAELLGLAPTGSSDPQAHQTATRQPDVGTVSDPSGAQDPSQLSTTSPLPQTQSLDAQPGIVLQQGLKRTHLLINTAYHLLIFNMDRNLLQSLPITNKQLAEMRATLQVARTTMCMSHNLA